MGRAGGALERRLLLLFPTETKGVPGKGATAANNNLHLYSSAIYKSCVFTPRFLAAPYLRWARVLLLPFPFLMCARKSDSGSQKEKERACKP